MNWHLGKAGVSRRLILGVTIAVAALSGALAGVADAQPRRPPEFSQDENSFGAIVQGEPYSADGTTKVTMVLGDGTHIDRSITAGISRDSAGRVRREQTIIGLAELNPARESEQVVTIVDTVAGFIYALNPATHEAHRMPLRPGAFRELAPPPPPPPPAAAGRGGPGRARGPGGPALPQPLLPPSREALGTREIDGVNAVGSRTTITIPTGQIGNDRPITMTDERWESPELKIVLMFHHHDPRTGDVEFRLTNLRREEPSPELFKVPADYTVVDSPAPPPPPPPGRPEGYQLDERPQPFEYRG